MDENNTVVKNMDGSDAIVTNGDGLTEKLKNFIRENYEPVQDVAEATLRLTTKEIHENISNHYPYMPFSANELAQWLHNSGYTFWDAGSMRLEWLMKISDTE